MSFYVDMDRNKGFFRKNGEQCIELNLNPSKLGYYPCVAMHSVGEAVEIIEKVFWEPVGTPDVSSLANINSEYDVLRYPGCEFDPLTMF